MKKLMFGLFAALMLFGFGFASLSMSAGTLSKASFKPGESGTITLTVTNLDASDIVQATSLEVNGPPEFTYTGSFALGDLNPGTSTTVTIPIKVGASATSSIYIFTIKAYGSIPGQAQSSSQNFRSSTSVAVPVLSAPVLSLGGYAGTFMENGMLSLNIVNNGGAAKNMRLSVLPPFAIYGTDSIYVGEVNGTKSVPLNLSVAAVGEGQSTLSVALLYDDELGNAVSEVKNISLTVKKEITDISVSQVSNIIAKKDNDAVFKVTNDGRAIRDVRLRFSDPNIIVKNGNDISLGDLASGETKQVSFAMHPDISPGVSNVNATLTYVEDGNEKSKSIIVALTINSNSDVQVYLDAKPLPLTKGEEQTLSVTVANTWDYPVESTSVGISGDFFDLLSVQNEQYIGLLKTDDFSSVQFKVKMHSDAPSYANLTVSVKYKDAFGNFVQKDKQIPLNIAERPAEQGSVLPYVGGAAVLIAIYLLFFRKKKPTVQ